VTDFSDPGELVCDPYAGSGTTGLACGQLGRRFIGWERDTAMAALAQRRLAGMRAVPVPGQIEMFG
jgi:DNA modification methylase